LILARLAALETGWGGGSSIGGAPRRPNGSRSFLPPDQVFELIEAELISQGVVSCEPVLESSVEPGLESPVEP
jgi:hypothetical protein